MKTTNLCTGNLAPDFKAGVNDDMVAIEEIGDINREIVYHGDVLNTESRIQEKCNEFDSNLLISYSLYNIFRNSDGFKFDEIGAINLKGKQKSTELFIVSKG